MWPIHQWKKFNPPPLKKKDPHTNLCKLAYKNSPYSELYAVLLKLWSQNALILNGTDAFESKMGLNSNNKCG